MICDVRRELAGKQVRLQAKVIHCITVGKADERSAGRNAEKGNKNILPLNKFFDKSYNDYVLRVIIFYNDDLLLSD